MPKPKRSLVNSLRSSISHRFGLQLQVLPKAADRVLVMCDLLGRRSPLGQFVAADVTEAFLSLSVPPPENTGPLLATLRSRGHVLQHPTGRWSVTPTGIEAVSEMGLGLAPEIDRQIEDIDGAQFAHVDHTLIPSWAAPPRWQVGIRRLHERYPFETNVFCMTRFPSEGDTPDPVKCAIAIAREVLAEYELHLHLASDAVFDDDLLGNVGAYMWACRYGMAIIEDRALRGLNSNAIIEVGGMILTGRRCVILKDRTAPSLPTDLSGQIYRHVDLDRPESVRLALEDWAGSDLGIKLATDNASSVN